MDSLSLQTIVNTWQQFNSYTEFHYLLRLWAISSLLLWASMHWKLQLSIHQVFQGSWSLPHPLISELTMVRALQPVNASPDWNLPTVPEMEPLKSYLCLFVSKRREMAQPVPTKAFLQPAKAAAMCTALRAETRPPPPIPPFLLAQNLSSKRIQRQLIMCGQSCMTSTLIISG